MNTHPFQPQSLCSKVVELATRTGKMVQEMRLSMEASSVHSKGIGDYVTDVDKASEKQLVQELGYILPEAGFVAEEGTSSKVGERYNWVVDPIDGTTNFIHNIPCYSISIALQLGDEVILGVVYEINRDECFYAWEGSPAYLNGTEISVSKAQTIADSLIAIGFPYDALDKGQAHIQALGEFQLKSRGVRRLGSAATDLAYVAVGRFECYFEYNLKPWDVAAGAFLVRQAGGKATDFDGTPDALSGQQIVASNGSIHQAVLDTIQKHFA